MTFKIEQTENGWANLLAEGRLARFALVCMGVWLSAVDSLVTSTIMPSVGADLGGFAYFSWATGGFFVGAILAGASAGRLSEMFGLRTATMLAGLVMTGGCIMSAAAPNVGLFMAGRIVQGLGSGWISGFAMVAIALLFPERHLARVFASVSGVWGVATLLGPAVGGLALEAGDWRGVFWLFAAQALGFSVAAPFLLKGSGSSSEAAPAIPWMQLFILGLGVTIIAVANLVPTALLSFGLVFAGLAVLAGVLWLDGRVKVRLLPHRAGDVATTVGAGYAAMFWLTAASMGFAIYAPPILQILRGFSPLRAGYVIGVESIAWTLSALVVAHVTGKWDARWIRWGALMLIASLLILPLTLADGGLGWILLGGALMGAAFGFSWSFISRRVLGALSDEDRAIGSAAITTLRQTGSAAGAAIAGAAANLAGFSHGMTAESARATSVWVFVSVIPLALIGTWAAYRLTRVGVNPAPGEAAA